MNEPQANKDLDEEWIELILIAFEIGLSVEEIRNFFKKTSRLL